MNECGHLQGKRARTMERRPRGSALCGALGNPLARATLAIPILAMLFLASRPDPVYGQEAEGSTERPIEPILERYVEDYAHDVTLDRPVSFGIQVDGEWWHVTARPAAEGEKHEVELHVGPPPEPTFYFTMDMQTLSKLDRGELNPGTAMVKEFSTDPSPMDADVMEGYQPDEGFLPTFLKVAFHFWTRGTPEIIPFNASLTRHTHGGDAVIFYYQPGFRSGWASIKPGQHVNADPRSQTNPFPSLFIATGGRGMAKIGGKEFEMKEGEAVLVPAEVTHEFWNPFDEPFEAILLMFGEGA